MATFLKSFGYFLYQNLVTLNGIVIYFSGYKCSSIVNKS